MEYTIPTFSWRMRPDPGFGVATWGASNSPAGLLPAVTTCKLPNEHTVFGVYIIYGVFVAFLLAHYLLRRLFAAFTRGKGLKDQKKR